MIRAAIVLTALVVRTAAAQTPPTTLLIPLLTTAPKIDGDLSDSVWTHALDIALPFQWFPDEGSTTAIATHCRLAATETALFLGCKATDPAPARIVAIRRDRDAAENDDGIAITIDPFGDGYEAFLFRVSASGILADAQLGRLTGTDSKWDAIWDGRAQRLADGYSIELKIPFSAMRMPALPTSPARVLIERGYPRRYNYVFGATTLDRNKLCRICQGLAVSFPEVRKRGLGALLQPTLTAANQVEDGVAVSDVELGGSARWQITPTLRTSATINPDFSQVEADELDFEVNRQFVLTYDERRPFFLEGREMLEGYGNLVYSRRIVNPVWGIRALNRGADQSFAVLLTREASDARIIPGPYASSQVIGTGGATSGAARFRYTPRREFVIGSVATFRESEQARNADVAIDADLQFADRHRVRFVSAFSTASYAADSAQQKFNGGMSQVRYDLSSRAWGAEFSVRAISPQFRTDVGLLQRVDLWGPEAQLQRNFWGGERRWYSLITASADAQYLQTFGSRLVDGKTGFTLSWSGAHQTTAAIAVRDRHTAVDRNEYHHTQVELDAGISDARWHTDAQVTLGTTPDLANTRLGRITAVRLAGAFAPTNSLRMTATARYEGLTAASNWVYHAAIGDVRVECYPRLNTRLRIVALYNVVDHNPAGGIVSGATRTDRFTLQTLISQRFGTRALVFVGYSGAGATSDAQSISWPASRSFFAKVAWDLAL